MPEDGIGGITRSSRSTITSTSRDVSTSYSNALTPQQSRALDAIGDKLLSIADGKKLREALHSALSKLQNSNEVSAFSELHVALMEITLALGQCPGGLDAETAQQILDVFQPSLTLTADAASFPLSVQELCNLMDESLSLESDVKTVINSSQGHEVFNLFNFPGFQEEMAIVYKRQDGTLMVMDIEEGGSALRVGNDKPQKLEDFLSDSVNENVSLLVLPDSLVSEDLRTMATSGSIEAESIASMDDIASTTIEIDGKTYAIPEAAIKGTSIAYAKEAIKSGLSLLGEINSADPDTLSKNSPIKSRQDMANLMWALDAKAWKISSQYQSGSGSMYVSDEDHKIYNALLGAKDESGVELVYGRGGKNESSHLKPFSRGKASQYGFNAYENGQSAAASRDVQLPYGKNTLLFGSLDPGETGFTKERIFIKLEGFGTDCQATGLKSRWNSFTNLLSHGLGWFKKVFLGINSLTRENDFREKTTAVSKMVSFFCERYDGEVEKDTLEQVKSASSRGLTTLAKCIQELNSSDNPSLFLQDFENEINEQLEDPQKGILKNYQQTAVDQWKQTDEGHGKSTLAYFATHDQSGRELILDIS